MASQTSPPPAPTMKDVLLNLIDPWLFMGISIQHIPQTVSTLVSTRKYGTLLSPSAFSEALFGQFWATVGPQVKESGEQRVVPLLQGRVKGGVVHEDVVSPPVSGTVIEVGAGSGMWADLFALVKQTGGGGGGVSTPSRREGLRKRPEAPSAATTNGTSTSGGLVRVYGVEPNPQSARALQQRVKDVGISDFYTVVPVGIESVDDPAAWDGKIEPGSVDCIVCILCLCSIPEPEKNIKLLYRLLKPGGRFYAYEHVKTTQVPKGNLFMQLYQRFVSFFWVFFLGSCRICRPTLDTLRAAGEWKDIDFVQPPDEPAFAVLPHLLGTLTKAD